jgi:hypothetical protein
MDRLELALGPTGDALEFLDDLIPNSLSVRRSPKDLIMPHPGTRSIRLAAPGRRR